MKALFTGLLSALLFFSLSFGEFTIVTIPDTQELTLSSTGEQYFRNAMSWIVAEKDALNVQLVAHLGDVVDTHHPSVQSQWDMATSALRILTDGGMDWTPCQGNHDELSYYRTAFPVSEWETKPWFGGYLGGMENAYYLFSWEGMDYIIVVIDVFWKTNYNQASLDWANQILDQYSNRRAIVISHNINEGATPIVSQVATQHDNVFFVTGGHSCVREDYKLERTPSGYPVHTYVADYQCDAEGGKGMLRYYTFKPESNQICSFTVLPTTNQYETDANSQFCVDYEMVPSTTPQISGVMRSPLFPQAGEAVAVSARITDDVSIASAAIKWGTEPGNLSNETAMTADGDTWSAAIPGQDNNTTIYYVVEASDGDGNTETSTSYTYTIETFLASWNSYDIVLSSGTPQATVDGEAGTADIELYESSDANGIQQASLFSSYGTSHPDAFNNLGGYWSGGASYPYIGKSSVPRGDDAGESGAMEPAGVFDLQYHPSNTQMLTVCAFIAPLDGSYKVANLGIRRVADGGSVAVRLFDNDGNMKKELTATSRSWTMDSDAYSFPGLTAGDRIYFGVSNVDGYNYDAAEVNWSIRLVDGEITVADRRTDLSPSQIPIHFNPAAGLITFDRPDLVASFALKTMDGKTILQNRPGRESSFSIGERISGGVLLLSVTDVNGNTFSKRLASF